MRLSQHFAACVLVLLSGNSAAADMPHWFANPEIEAKRYLLVGYGAGNTPAAARKQARDDIAKQMHTNIRSETFWRTSSTANGFTQNDYEQRVHELSQAKLYDVEVIHSEERGGTHYVALRFDIRRAERKFLEKGGKGCSKDKGHPYLARSPLFRELRQLAGCAVDAKLLRNNGLWYLAQGAVSQVLSPWDFERLYTSVNSLKVFLTASKPKIKAGEAFHLNYRVSQDGYISLFNVYADGIVTLHMNNKPVRAGESYRYPDNLVSGGAGQIELQAGLLQPGQETRDLYVAVLTNKPANNGRYIPAGDTAQTGERHYQFGELLGAMSSMPFGSTVVWIQPR